MCVGGGGGVGWKSLPSLYKTFVKVALSYGTNLSYTCIIVFF